MGSETAERRGCAYAVDGHDRITAVNDAWERFATENEGSLLVPHRVLRTNLWDHIGGMENRLIYKRMLDHVRAGSRSVSFNLRCDSPSCVRFLRMTIDPLPEEGCLFRTELLRVEHRVSVALLARNTRRCSESVSLCGWCMGLHVGGRWFEFSAALERMNAARRAAWPQLAHTICPSCYEQLDALLASTRLAVKEARFRVPNGRGV